MRCFFPIPALAPVVKAVLISRFWAHVPSFYQAADKGRNSRPDFSLVVFLRGVNAFIMQLTGVRTYSTIWKAVALTNESRNGPFEDGAFGFNIHDYAAREFETPP
jgi:hypothetical protein